MKTNKKELVIGSVSFGGPEKTDFRTSEEIFKELFPGISSKEVKSIVKKLGTCNAILVDEVNKFRKEPPKTLYKPF